MRSWPAASNADLAECTISGQGLHSASVRFQIATLGTAKGVHLELCFSGDLRAHPDGLLRLAGNPGGGTPVISVSPIHEVTDFHFELTLGAFLRVVHSVNGSLA